MGALVDGRLAAGYVAHARAVVAGDAPGLDEVSLAFEDMGADLLAAEAAVEAAASHAQAGLTARHAASTAHAARLVHVCGNPRTPILAQLAETHPRSPRQREVANLAAEGRSNREIAGLLVVSVRTVEGHLASTFAKLGVTRREELKTVLR